MARRTLDDWLAATVAADRIDTKDLWLRCSAWRLGRVIDSSLAQTGPDKTPSRCSYGTCLYAQGIDPDAADDLRYHRTPATAPRR